MGNVAISRNVLMWALKRSGVAMDDLHEKFPKLDSWLDGSAQPTLKQVEVLARATRTPFGFFFLSEPPEDVLPISDFRTLGDKKPPAPSPELLETVQYMQQRQMWLRELLIEEGSAKVSVVGSAKPNERPKEVARKIREALGFDENWASEHSSWTGAMDVLRDGMEAIGISVVVNGIVRNNTHRKLAVDEFRGFVLVDEYAPLVFVNGADGKAAQMFTLAHELAHVFFGSSAAFDLKELQASSDPTEQACNETAAEFLVPEDELKRLWPKFKVDPKPFQQIAKHFKVSYVVAARRGLDLRLITRTEFHKIYEDYLAEEKTAKDKQSKTSGGDFYATQNLRIGRRFGETVYRAAHEGKILYSEAYRLTGLYGRTFDEFAKRQGLGRLKRGS